MNVNAKKPAEDAAGFSMETKGSHLPLRHKATAVVLNETFQAEVAQAEVAASCGRQLEADGWWAIVGERRRTAHDQLQEERRNEMNEQEAKIAERVNDMHLQLASLWENIGQCLTPMYGLIDEREKATAAKLFREFALTLRSHVPGVLSQLPNDNIFAGAFAALTVAYLSICAYSPHAEQRLSERSKKRKCQVSV